MIRVFGTCQVSVPEYRYPRYVPVPGSIGTLTSIGKCAYAGRYQSKFSLKAGIPETEKGIVVYSFLWPKVARSFSGFLVGFLIRQAPSFLKKNN